MKVLTVIGARPQFIKCAPVSRSLRGCAKEILVHTDQHYDRNMSRIFFHELGIPRPDYNLGVRSGPHGLQTGKMLMRLERVLVKEQPDYVLIYGDTNSTLAGALAAAKLRIPVAHVEAGLRSFNRAMPEEINRTVADHVSTLLFAPTSTAVRNLRCEGITDNVFLVGDVMYDAARQHLEGARERSRIMRRLGIDPKAYVLATVHRAENTDDPDRLGGILQALERLARELYVVFPAHPRTQKALRSLRIGQTKGLLLIEPVSYLDMLVLESQAHAILTDSGGVQKEAYFFRVPCVTLRNETEWVETVESGWNVLAGAQTDQILRAVHNVKPGRAGGRFYGDGRASERIVRILTQRADRAEREGEGRPKRPMRTGKES
jgi:UDP-N-acetylglucosamine 2-epimerase